MMSSTKYDMLLAYIFTGDILKMLESSDLTILLLLLTDKKHLGGAVVHECSWDRS